MNDILFVWDKRKATINERKHGISFEEAQTVFYDEHSIEFFDPGHAEDEDRFIMLGLSFKLRILIVCYCVKEDTAIRIISARKATRHEAKSYQGDRT